LSPSLHRKIKSAAPGSPLNSRRDNTNSVKRLISWLLLHENKSEIMDNPDVSDAPEAGAICNIAETLLSRKL
jgi:hypothetical protein